MTPTIEASRRSQKRFGKVRALDGLDLCAGRRRARAVLGPNGAGKSTFVRPWPRWCAPDSGRCSRRDDARRDPRPVRRADRARRPVGRRRGGDDRPGEPRDGRPAVRPLSARPRAARAERLDALGLTDAAERLVRGWSGGMRRRLDLGASLVGAPRLLLLDEPTTGLDPGSRIGLWEAIRELVAGGTDVVLTTQYLEEADHLADPSSSSTAAGTIATGCPAS